MTRLHNLMHRVESIRLQVAICLGRLRGATSTHEERLKSRIHDRIRSLGALYEDGNSILPGHTYHPIYFPEFGAVPAHRAACDQRLRTIVDDLQPRAGDWVLDVGANVGYFSFGLSEAGAYVEAYEAESNSFEIGAALARLFDANVNYINRPMAVRTLPLLRSEYRAVLLLSVFHWIVKQEGEEGAVTVLRTLVRAAERLYFEVPCDVNDAMYHHPWFSSPDSVAAFLQQHLPGCEIARVWEDPAWSNRVLWRVRQGA